MSIRIFLLSFFVICGCLVYPLNGQEEEKNTKEESPTGTPKGKPDSSKESKANAEKEDTDASKEDSEKDAPTGTPKGKDDKEVKDDKKEEKELEPPKIGNFALPASQQPAALFGLGGNIIDKGEVQIYTFIDVFKGRKKFVSDVIPSILFGITDEWSLYFNAPFTPYMKDGHQHSTGLEDFFIQLEYAFYNKKTGTYSDQATILTNITTPTGSTKKNPSTGFGAPSLFIGGTYYRVWIDWLVFTSHGAVLTSSNHGTKIGDQFFYQMGFGKSFPTDSDYNFTWMIEVDGQYNRKNRIHGHIDRDSGGNVLYVTPSVWYSTKDILLQFGPSFSINQNLFGRQHKVDFAFNVNFAYSFY
jgi:hypothetical protein